MGTLDRDEWRLVDTAMVHHLRTAVRKRAAYPLTVRRRYAKIRQFRHPIVADAPHSGAGDAGLAATTGDGFHEPHGSRRVGETARRSDHWPAVAYERQERFVLGAGAAEFR